MELDRKARDAAVLERLLRRAGLVIQHYRYRGQPVDVRGVVRRVLTSCKDRPENVMQYRADLEAAVRSLIHGFR
jgi:hypothetical protein